MEHGVSLQTWSQLVRDQRLGVGSLGVGSLGVGSLGGGATHVFSTPHVPRAQAAPLVEDCPLFEEVEAAGGGALVRYVHDRLGRLGDTDEEGLVVDKHEARHTDEPPLVHLPCDLFGRGGRTRWQSGG